MKKTMLTLVLIVSSVACQRSVNLTINGRKPEYLTAKIEKNETNWKVTTYLPIGNWSGKLENEGSEVQIDSSGPRPIAIWFISNERMRQTRPMRLALFDPNGHGPLATLELKPQYPGEKFIEGVLSVIYWGKRPGTGY